MFVYVRMPVYVCSFKCMRVFVCVCVFVFVFVFVLGGGGGVVRERE